MAIVPADLPQEAITLLIGVWTVLLASLVLGFGYWVYRDASLRGSSNPLGWAAASVVGFQVMTLVYPFLRERIGSRTEPPSRIDRAVPATIVGILIAFAVGAIVTPPDPFAQVVFVTGAIFVTIPAVYAFVVVRDRRATAD